jgi:hypothetical protein
MGTSIGGIGYVAGIKLDRGEIDPSGRPFSEADLVGLATRSLRLNAS